MKNKLVIVALLLAGLAVIALIAIGPSRLSKARKEADNFAADKGITTQYEPAEEIKSKEALLTEIWKLVQWEETTRPEINEAFGYTDEEYSDRDPESKTGYEKEETLLAFAMKEKWASLRKGLDRSVEDAVTAIFERADDSYGLDEEAVQTCYIKDYFGKITEVMQSVENGAGMEAYNLARNGLSADWSSLPMDIAYGLRPKLIMAGCEASLLSAVNSNELYDISSAVSSAQRFEKRYNVTVDGLKDAEKKEERLEYANKPDIPTVGMSKSQACSTKLGSPTKTTKETGSWMHKKHTYGDMYWYSGDRQIFRAHYLDGEITDVYDSRNYTGTSPWAGSSDSSSHSSFDPDDHDIEAYYEDNRDEYDDYDDAYEGFLDDEGAWDDY